MGRVAMVLAAVAAGGLLLGLVVVGGIGEAASSSAGAATEAVVTALRDRMCTTATGPLRGLSAQQAANAETIVSVLDSSSAENPQAARIALMTAITESHLTDDHGGLGGAIGLFQQTPPAWGTPQQLVDPAYAAGQFGRHLLALPGWQQLRPWVAAQDVQQSGAGQPDSPLNPLPGVLGGNYKLHWDDARKVYDLVVGAFTSGGCGGGPPAGVVGPAGRHGLPAGYRIPARTPRRVRPVLRYVLSKLGDAYVWGAAGPTRFDCSGLTMTAWARAGVQLDHYTVDQMREGRRVSASQTRPGDLVLVPGSDAPGPGLPGHVGIYLGDGLVESAIDPQQGLAVQSWRYFTAGGLDAVVDPLP